jgi:methylenetetrahydrofolate reductase (NADPH)
MYEEEQEAAPTDLCIGAACYPEKHPEALNMSTDMAYLKKKVEAGAEYLVTQMFFDNSKYFAFVDECRANGITVPIIPGLKPITNRKQTKFLPKTFHIDLPVDYTNALERCKNDDEVKQMGIDFGIQQAKELKAAGVPCLHFYTMGRSEAVRAIVQEVF